MKVLYTGSFNPFHNGHEYIYDLACQMFGDENVWIGIGKNSDKSSVDIEHLKNSIHPITRNVLAYDTLTADVVKAHGFQLLIRGIRPSFNLEDEFQLMYWNRELCGIDTILLSSSPDLNNLSSGAIRTLLGYKKSVSKYMNPDVLNRWQSPTKPEDKYVIYFGKCCCGKTTYLNRDPSVIATGKQVLEFDRIWPEFMTGMTKSQVKVAQKSLKEHFYRKDTVAFTDLYMTLSGHFDWNKLFREFPPQNYIYDIPSLGWCWHSIPRKIIASSELIRVTASIYDRIEFSVRRKADPQLIGCSDFFYMDPPFWDRDIVIKKG